MSDTFQKGGGGGGGGKVTIIFIALNFVTGWL